MIAVC